MASAALWIPLFWIMIAGSRPLSFWLSGGVSTENLSDYFEGRPLDSIVLLFLIILGLAVLLRRGISWGRILSWNPWAFAFILYCGISVIWSDYPFVSFKRWIKDLGNVCMVLILVTEKDPVQAIRAVFARYTYFAIALSAVFIKYFPDLGRHYNQWTWEYAYTGIAMEKNALGSIALLSGLLLVWDLIRMRTEGERTPSKGDLLSRVSLLLIVFWLMDKASSATALVCLGLVAGLLLLFRFPVARRQVKYLGTYGLVLGLLILFLYSVPGLPEALAGMVGRNITLTGRTDIWADLLKEPVNPFLGAGYQSFWTPAMRQSHLNINQAHNGYLEVYLNDGLVGVFLIVATIISAGSRLKNEVVLGNSYGILRLLFLVTAVIYNWTEASFYGLNLIWIIFLVSALKYFPSSASLPIIWPTPPSPGSRQ